MISANHKYITENDIKEVLRINPDEDDFQSSFVTDGKYLYYVDGFTNPQEIRVLSEEEQFQNLPELAKGMKMTEEELIAFMLDTNKNIDYYNIPDNGFNSMEEIEKWWEDKDAKLIFEVYDEYMGIPEMIIDCIG